MQQCMKLQKKHDKLDKQAGTRTASRHTHRKRVHAPSEGRRPRGLHNFSETTRSPFVRARACRSKDEQSNGMESLLNAKKGGEKCQRRGSEAVAVASAVQCVASLTRLAVRSRRKLLLVGSLFNPVSLTPCSGQTVLPPPI